MFRKIKHFIQRGKRGWSDEDTWDFDSYLCTMIPGALRKLKDGVGCPERFYDSDAINNEFHLWHEAIEAMAQGFEAVKFLKDYKYNVWVDSKDNLGYKTLEIDYKAMENAKVKMELGLKLFAENFLNLWD
jgi:hypothetical protein